MIGPSDQPLLRTISNGRRLQVLATLEAAPRTTSELADTLKLSPAVVRRHLRRLIQEGHVEAVDPDAVAPRYRTKARGWIEVASALEAIERGYDNA